MLNWRAFLKRHMVIGPLLVVLAAAGCGAESDPDAAAATTASPAPSSGPVSVPAPRSPASEEPEATEEEASDTSGANSADYESCDDGECEVSFSGSAEFPLGGTDGQWTVEVAFEDDGVRVNLTKPNGLGGGGGLLYHPDCTLATNADGSGSLSCAEEGDSLPEPGAGGIVVHLLERSGDTAVVQAVLG